MSPVWRLVSRLSFAIGLMCLAAVAEPRDEIQQQYRRSSEATQLKFLDGIYCIRSPKFRLIDHEGQVLDLAVERTRMEQFLAPALKVDEKVTIDSLEVQGSSEVVCDVTYVTKLRVYNRLTDKESDQILTTRCSDRWQLTNKGWRMVESRVVEQDYQR